MERRKREKSKVKEEIWEGTTLKRSMRNYYCRNRYIHLKKKGV